MRKSDFIAAARMQGASPLRIVLFHIAPLCTSSLIVRLTLDMAGIILTAAGLGFLGLGAQPPAPEWGAMISTGRQYVLDYWWVATMPGLAIVVVSLGFNLLGDGLRDVLDEAALSEQRRATDATCAGRPSRGRRPAQTPLPIRMIVTAQALLVPVRRGRSGRRFWRQCGCGRSWSSVAGGGTLPPNQPSR